MKCKRKCMGKRVQRCIRAFALLLIFPYLFGGCGFARQTESLQVIGSDGQPVTIGEKNVEDADGMDAVNTDENSDSSVLQSGDIGAQTGINGATNAKTTDGASRNDAVGSSQEVSSTVDNPVDAEGSSVCVVYVCGAVKRSGVYHLPQGARIVDAIEAAGGCTKSADSECLNQAEFVTDGQRLYIPKKGEQGAEVDIANQIDGQNALDHSQNNQSGIDSGINSGINSGKINLNTATKEQLMTLPGVGESKALAIITYRQEHGGFQSIEEIKKISGIKDGVYNKIKDSIVVG